MAILHDTDFSELRRILDDSLLTPVFQPIIDFRTRTILGYETLIRGPENSPLHRPDVLFARLMMFWSVKTLFIWFVMTARQNWVK